MRPNNENQQEVGMSLTPALVAGAIAVAAAPKGVELTIYNANFGLVKEVRSLAINTGRQEVRISDVAAYIDPTSVSFKGLTAGTDLEVLEQNYQYDLLSPQSILLKSIGKRIRLRQLLSDGKVITTEGTLLSAPGQVISQQGGQYQTYTGMVLHADDGRYILDPIGTVEVLELPEGLISKPTLMWDLVASKSGSVDVELAYLTNQINWSSDYVLTLDSDDTRADLNGWVTINNQSGASYKDAVLKLIAGDVRRVQPRFRGAAESLARDSMRAGAAGGFVEEQLFEYHLYTLSRPATIRDRETKQIALLSAPSVPVKKELIFEGQRSMWYGAGRGYRPGEGYASDPNIKVNIIVELVNSEKSGLGIPLPKGKVRVYKRDAKGQVQMLGEDEIDHTPREEKIRLYIGDAFDVVGERRRTQFKRIATNVVEESFEIKLRNRKKVVETVKVVEHGWADWRILSESMPSEKIDSNTFQYVVSLEPDKEVIIRYTIQTTW